MTLIVEEDPLKENSVPVENIHLLFRVVVFLSSLGSLNVLELLSRQYGGLRSDLSTATICCNTLKYLLHVIDTRSATKFWQVPQNIESHSNSSYSIVAVGAFLQILIFGWS